jgi:ATP-dependent helicase/nuclease subunit A
MPLFAHVQGLAEAAAQAAAAELRDALSTMYVAMTRARHALHIMVKPDGPGGAGTARTPARLLREAIAPQREVLATGDVLHEVGDADWHRTPAATAAADEGTVAAGGDEATAASADTAAQRPPRTHSPAAVRLRQPDRRSRGLPRRSPSALEGGDETDLAFILRLGAAASRARGSIAHLWLERITWLDDGVPAAAQLADLARSVSPDMDDAEIHALVARFHQWIAAPAVHALLSRAHWPQHARVETEVPFIHRDGDVLVEGYIDRLITLRDGDDVTGAAIIDYKTDAIETGDAAALDARRRHYAPQLEAYRRAVARMYALPLAAVEARLVFLECGAA